ncbi:porin family protein [Altererythrobacter sp. BO-6]|uniref:outer membrane protein n=1 Tax=Altererythrobacter sp. BO-6 TaxID=2604537 RepID=UPI0013E10D1C|nr:outer membrane beta-barrel protein [Altererythrobacter sp. BO-6]QIG52898.1 porin family protein [Altererythrobacter sp. BO-6]
MKRYNSFVCLAAAATAVSASPAMAQDDESWTGLYAGVHVGLSEVQSESDVTLGGAWSTETQGLRDFIVANAGADQKEDNVNLGLQLGYNYQTGPVVFGAEIEFSSFEKNHIETRGPLKQTANAATSYTFSNTVKPESLASAKAKLGLTTGSTLFYLTGGWAMAEMKFGAGITSSANYLKQGSLKKDTDGFTVGGGIEQRLTRNISARLSYDYTDQGSVNYTTAYRPGSAFTTPAYSETVNQDLKLHFIRLGVNYTF